MQRNGLYILYMSACIGLLCLLASPPCYGNSEAKDFILVIDAGHGGHDPGAVGRISKEKDINLKVARQLGELIETECPDVKIIYTRKRDVFIPLNRRAQIANDAKADLFISIHTNSLAKNHTAKGASTWTLGLAKSQANLEVAKRENAVILYEDDYKTRYAGFDPNSSESYIIFEFMQDKYMSQSVHLASLVQQQLHHTCRRIDRGVHQAGFLVLKASAMPSILIELGFISTPEEERYLNSKEGINTLSKGIFRAFLAYKQEQQARTSTSAPATTATNSEPPKAARATASVSLPVFKIQILTSSELLRSNDKRLKGLKDVKHYKEKGLYKYTYGSSNDYEQILRLKQSIASKFKDAFIIAFKKGEKMDIHQAIQEYNEHK